MAFDLASAQPVTSSGFDLASAKPVGAPQETYSPTDGMSGTDKFLAGAGKAFVDLGRGVGQFTGLESRQNVADSRQLDAPLMATGAGKAGNIVGNIAATAPALAIPGAATVPGAAVLGAAFGAAQPSTSTRETLTNTGLGAVTGAVGQKVGTSLSNAVTNKLASRTATAAANQSQNAERDAVLQQARQAGYVIPPTAVNPNAVNTALESVSGKAATRQGASAKNAIVTNDGVRQDLGIAPNAPITRQALQGVRAQAGQAYQRVKAALGSNFASDGQYAQDLANVQNGMTDLEQAYPGISRQANPEVEALIKSASVASHNGNDAVGLSKFLRSQAKDNYRAAFGPGGNPTKLALATAQTRVANALEDLVDRTLTNSGQGDLATAWNDARTTIAKSYQAEGALKGGNVSAVKLAQQLQKGKPVSGQMGLAAQFANHFEDVAKLPKSGVGVSKLGATLAAGLGGEAAFLHSPTMAAGAVAAAAAPYAVRAGLLSRVGQNALANPSYAPGMLGTGALNSLKLLGRGSVPIDLATSNALIQPAQ